MSSKNGMLPAVADEDKQLVHNVIQVMEKLGLVSSWQVIVNAKRYEVIGWIDSSTKEDVILRFDDINLIKQVNYVRVEMPRIKILKDSGKICISVIVIPHKEEVMLEEETLQFVRMKRKRWGIF